MNERTNVNTANKCCKALYQRAYFIIMLPWQFLSIYFTRMFLNIRELVKSFVKQHGLIMTALISVFSGVRPFISSDIWKRFHLVSLMNTTTSNGIAEFAGLEYAGLENDGLENDVLENDGLENNGLDVSKQQARLTEVNDGDE